MSRKKGWDAPPSVVVISGTDEYLRHREVRKARAGASKALRRLVDVEAGDSEGLSAVLSGSLFFSDQTLVLVEGGSLRKTRKKKATTEPSEDTSGWTEDDLALVAAHHASGDDDVCLVIVQPGEPTATSFAAQVVAACPKVLHITFEAPKFWALNEHATKFLRNETVRLGKSISEPLAKNIVDVVGPDLGLLSFEAAKYSRYLDAVGRTEVTTDVVRPLMAAFGATEVNGLVTAVETRNVKSILRAIRDVRDGSAGARGVTVISRTLGTNAIGWLMIASLLERGSSADEIASRIGWKPYRVQQAIPTARRWGVSGLSNLIRGLAVADKSQRMGHISPWTELEVELIRACEQAG